MPARSLSESFGEIVRLHRGKLGLTQEVVAERAGIHATYVGMVERGERNCSIDIAAAIAASLDLPLSALIGEAEAQSAKKARSLNRKGRVA
jgi:transcriptional regulator with XRE-family HTH domain